MQCQYCRFWKPLVSQKGKCRRHVPTLSSTKSDAIGIWPETSMYDWCGEFEFAETQDPAKGADTEDPASDAPR